MRHLDVDGHDCFGLDLCEDTAGLWLSVQCNDRLSSPWVLEKNMSGAIFTAKLPILSTELEATHTDILGMAGCQHVAELAGLMGAPQVADIFAKLAGGPFAPADL